MLIIVGNKELVKDLSVDIKYKILEDTSEFLSEETIKNTKVVLFLNQPKNPKFLIMFDSIDSYSLGEKNSSDLVMELTPDVVERYIKQKILKNSNIERQNKNKNKNKNRVSVILKIMKIIAITTILLFLINGFVYYKTNETFEKYSANINEMEVKNKSIRDKKEELSKEQRNLIEEKEKLERQLNESNVDDSDDRKQQTTESLTNISQFFASLEHFDINIMEREYKNQVYYVTIEYEKITDSLEPMLKNYQYLNPEYTINNEDKIITMELKGGGEHEYKYRKDIK